MITEKQLTDALTIPNVIAWLERYPADTQFDYSWPQDCLLARYVKQTFNVSPEDRFGCNPSEIRVNDTKVSIPRELDYNICRSKHKGIWTYGAALAALKNVNRAAA